VSEPVNLNNSTIADDGLKCRVLNWPVKRLAAEPKIYCAYNGTREQFLCNHVELADPRIESLQERFAPLAPGSESALWLAPFLGISPDHVTAPIDLIYLDRNNCVLAVVESFPIAEETSMNLPAGTVLALPAQTIAATGTLVGDQLILCSPQKMKTRLDSLQACSGGLQRAGDLSYIPFFPSAPGTRMQMASWEEIRRQTIFAERAAIKASRAMLAQNPSARPISALSFFAQNIAASARNSLFPGSQTDHQESRKSPREFLPWVAAYFANREARTPASVRNISIDGMFVSTSERWFLGKIVQVMLTDWRVPSLERSIIINAMAVRWTNDGVGLRFIFQKPYRGKSAVMTDAPLVDVTEKDLKHFLQDFKRGKKALR
jgi:hypothetical protein